MEMQRAASMAARSSEAYCTEQKGAFLAREEEVFTSLFPMAQHN